MTKNEEFQKWAASEGRSIKPSSEYSPQVYASAATNNALAGWEARQPAIDALKKENDHLRASLAYSGGPCIYCNLPKEDWSGCEKGFPACYRKADSMLCPHVGADIETTAEVLKLTAEIETLGEAVDALVDYFDGVSRADYDKVCNFVDKLKDARG